MTFGFNEPMLSEIPIYQFPIYQKDLSDYFDNIPKQPIEKPKKKPIPDIDIIGFQEDVNNLSIHISKGNMKLGIITNISLRPELDCPNCHKCHKECYAQKSYRQYTNVRKAWGDNSTIARSNMNRFFTQLKQYFNKHKPHYFRIHVGGDFFSQQYVDMWLNFAHINPSTKFLAFTKTNFDFSKRPSNFIVIYSQWEGLDVHGNGIRAWISRDNRTPLKAFKCPSNCEKCLYCFEGKGDVVFKLH